ncbi:Helix-turn-helix domain-containing protein [Chitinophaga rupis]|uniref:Helix-turn-helix domain-containing protein n=1 Tax=Chitinophaga rupis TaxID=573321 RepID=A0A1H7UT44_9BACT|nr:helix-turn-helix domain-containing protein [Chitinophaga rupis]SEL99845.1 Helix-turn-helix domain-containing protein [Chitinophaga rupis]
MQVSLLKPGSSELQKYIECFYILKRSAQEEPINYLTFPSVFSIVVISQHTRTVHHKQQLTITYDPETPLETKLVANFNKPVLVRYVGAANEITAYFKPLGLNAFLDEPLSTFQKEDYTDFKPFPDYERSMQRILSITEQADKIKALESYWLGKLKRFEHPFLPQLVHAFSEAGEMASVTAQAIVLGVSRVTVTNEFRKHLGLTPGHFKKIIRLRKSISEQKKQPGNRLSDLTYALDYFDQSHMTREFRALTGMPPKKFFRDIAHIDPEYISWMFLSPPRL